MCNAYKCALVILCLSRFKLFNLVFSDKLVGYILLIIIKNTDVSSHWKSNWPFFVIHKSKTDNFVQTFW